MSFDKINTPKTEGASIKKQVNKVWNCLEYKNYKLEEIDSWNVEDIRSILLSDPKLKDMHSFLQTEKFLESIILEIRKLKK